MKLYFPVDYVTADKFADNATVGAADDETGGIPDGLSGLDCGPKSRKIFSEVIASARTIVWNGPLGVFEFDNFAAGTKVKILSLSVLSCFVKLNSFPFSECHG